MKFEKFGGEDGAPAAWLKVGDGCYVRIRDITCIGTGVMSDDGSGPVLHPNVVALTLVTGDTAAFDPCESPEAARAMADELVLALEEQEKKAADRARYLGVLRHGF